jgi:putative PIN family toxin of toxin-antitoxin system
MTGQPVLRVVFDTNTVISALVFSASRLAWLRRHWRSGACVPLVCRATVTELIGILEYSKFRLSAERRLELQGDYLPYCESISCVEQCPVSCRDAKDQPFLDLAHCGKADLLVSGDDDLLSLAGQTSFVIESPEFYRRRVAGAGLQL